MADKKISQLNQITGSSVNDATDELPIVDASASETKAITRAELFSNVANISTDGALTVGGNITVTGTVDGRDLATDGAKLDAIDQGVATTDDVTFANITTSGYLRGPASFTIDPAAHGDNTGTLIVAGNLQVDGTTTTINSQTLTVDDKNIVMAHGAANAAAADGGGITVDGANATLTYAATGDKWVANKSIDADIIGNVTGTVSDISNHDTDDLAEGVTNLYYTSARFTTDFGTKDTDDLTQGSTNLYFTTTNFNTEFATKDTDDLSEGVTNLYFTSSRFNTEFATKDTDDLSEGLTNLYYTDARANAAIDARVDKTFVDNLGVDAATLGGNSYTDFATTADATALAIALG